MNILSNTKSKRWLPLLWVVTSMAVAPSCGKKPKNSARLKSDSSMSYGRKIDATAKTRETSRVYVGSRNAITGSKGMLEVSTRLSEKSLQWVNQWGEMDTYLSSAATKPIQQVDRELRVKLQSQLVLLGEIKSIQEDLAQQNTSVQAKLAAVPVIDYVVEGYESQNQALHAAVANLKVMASSVSSGAQTHAEKLKASGVQLAKAMRVKLVSVYIAANIAQLNEAKAMATAMFDAEELLTPFEVEFQRDYLRFQGTVSNGRVYAVEDSLPLLLAKSLQIKSSMGGSGATQEYIARAQARIDRLTAEAQSSAVKFKDGTYNIPKLVAESSEERISSAKSECEGSRPTIYNCETYQWISIVPTSEILSLTGQGLKAFEMALDSMEIGGLLQNGGL